MTLDKEFEAWLHEFDEAGLVRDCDIVILDWMQATWKAARANDARKITELEVEIATLIHDNTGYIELANEDANTIVQLEAQNKVLVDALQSSDDLLRSLENSGNFYGLAVMENNAQALAKMLNFQQRSSKMSRSRNNGKKDMPLEL